MKLYNYVKLFGAFTNAHQVIALPQEPTDRQERKMLEEAKNLVDAGWGRKHVWLTKQENEGKEIDFEAEKRAFYPKVEDGKVLMPLQYLQDFMTRKIAAVQNNASIHDAASVHELKEVFVEYDVQLTSMLTGLTMDHIAWSEKPGQKPKVLLHAKEIDADGVVEDVCVRFEVAGELCQKLLHAILALNVKEGDKFDLTVEAVDPAIERNKAAGKQVAEPRKYVNHNLKLVCAGKGSHTGHPPKGQRFVQKPTIEQMETLFKQAQFQMEGKKAA